MNNGSAGGKLPPALPVASVVGSVHTPNAVLFR